MEDLKEAGYWLVGLDETGEKNYTEVDYSTPTGIRAVILLFRCRPPAQ